MSCLVLDSLRTVEAAGQPSIGKAIVVPPIGVQQDSEVVPPSFFSPLRLVFGTRAGLRFVSSSRFDDKRQTHPKQVHLRVSSLASLLPPSLPPPHCRAHFRTLKIRDNLLKNKPDDVASAGKNEALPFVPSSCSKLPTLQQPLSFVSSPPRWGVGRSAQVCFPFSCCRHPGGLRVSSPMESPAARID
jgi:hypothetical protein